MGCGWLGLPLAQHLVQHGFLVKGSTTAQNKLPHLKQLNIAPFLITATSELNGENIDSFFQSNILFLNIPFRRNLVDPVYYKEQIDAIVSSVQSSPIEFIIFASSTSVYPASASEALEDEPFATDNPRSNVLHEIEQTLLDQSGFETTVIRFAGLYGGDRKIGRMLAGRMGVTEGKAPVNLIHLEDCIEIVTRIIQKDIRGEIFNACSDGHPTREEIYTKAAMHYRVKPPQFVDQPQQRFKIVSNTKLKDKLDFVFKHSNPLHF